MLYLYYEMRISNFVSWRPADAHIITGLSRFFFIIIKYESERKGTIQYYTNLEFRSSRRYARFVVSDISTGDFIKGLLKYKLLTCMMLSMEM